MSFKNTGDISLLLYGVFILITIAFMIIAIQMIKKGNIEVQKLDKMIDLFKYSVVSVAIATVSLIISDLFKEREQDVNELIYFDKYSDDIKKADGIVERYHLSKYLAIVAPNGDLKKSWQSYYDTVKIEYLDYLSLKEQKEKLEENKLNNEFNSNKKKTINDKIKQLESPIISDRKSDESAKGLFNLAESHFYSNEYKKSVDLCFDLISKYSYIPEWNDKAFLLVAKNYIYMGENFRARATLESIIANTPREETIAKANQLLKTLREKENKED